MPQARLVVLALICAFALATPLQAELKVGAAAVDVTPERFPVLINGGFFSRTGEPKDIYARAIVLDDGEQRIAIVVTDSCMLPKDLIDSAKQLAAQRSQIKPDHMLISATHTHTAPSSMGALGTPPDETYVPYLRIKLAEAILAAEKNLAPAKVGWGSVDANQFTALRRWILRPDQMQIDPFGEKTVRASMHTAKNNLANVTGESGPEDPELAVISFQTLEDKPIAVLANFSMHYFGGGGAADYFGAYCQKLEQELAPQPQDKQAPFVAVMSHGCSGDIWRVDYRNGTNQTFDGFVDGMIAKTKQALEGIDYQSDVPLNMAETRMRLDYRVPDASRLAKSKQIVDAMGDRLPQTREEVYALEQLILHERQSTEIVLQALKIGSIAIATTPNETYALTGLKLKARSPLEQTMVIELANGGDGYIPPPEQHFLGGYNTWAARSAGLETTAEPKIVEASVKLLEQAVGQPQRPALPPASLMATKIKGMQPVRYFPLDDMQGTQVYEATNHENNARFEDGIVFYLEGATGPALATENQLNRAAHFAGGRIVADVPELAGDFTISLWGWNGIDLKARPVAGWLASHHGIHLGLAGDGEHAGQLMLQIGDDEASRQFGKTAFKRWAWDQIALVRAGKTVRVLLNGETEIETEAALPESDSIVYLGGQSSNQNNWEGRLDEVAMFNRALSASELQSLADDGTQTDATAATPVSADEQTKGGRHWVAEKTPAPRTPQEELASFQIEPGYRIELVAAEPLVQDPVAIAFDADGRMFVAEYSDYPTGPANSSDAPLSRIVWLEDVDGDGVMDKRHLFADKLNFCHSLIPHAGGILACAQSELILLKDTTNDGQADVREVLFSGFQPAHPQMQVGCPRWGLDNRIYLNYGVGNIMGPGQTAATKIPGQEFWFDPLTYEFGAASGTGQYGNTITAWGDRLFATNRNPIIATTMTNEEATRNKFFAVRGIQYDVAPSGGNSKVFPLVAMKSNWLSHAGTHTSACGTTAYVGDGLGPKMVDSVFACEPIGHLVTRAVVSRDGARLHSQRAREDADFLAATDTWFRPASLANGPDGMLYLADMYRLWVEHPKFLPPEIAAQLDWRAGEDRGRIWRIVPEDLKKQPSYHAPKSTEDLVAMLANNNGWQRRTAQQLLVEGKRTEAAPALKHLATTSQSEFGRLHALWTLEGLKQLDADTIQALLEDPSSAVRAAAVRLASRHWQAAPQLLQTAFKRTQDKDPWVRYQLALALGTTDAPNRIPALAFLASHDGGNPDFADAILTATETCSGAVLWNTSNAPPTADAILRRLAKVVGARRDPEELARTVSAISEHPNPHRKLVIMSGLAEGLNGKSKIDHLFATSEKQRQAFFQQLAAIAADNQSNAEDRRDAIFLMMKCSQSDARLMTKLCLPQEPPLVQQAAITALAAEPSEQRGRVLLNLWKEMAPAARETTLTLLLRQPVGIELVLNKVRAGEITPNQISLDQQAWIRKHPNPAIRKQAEDLLGQAASTDRAAVLAQYEPATHTIGSPLAGRAVFLRQCAKCHAPTEPGGPTVGPDLSDSQNRPREAILFDILDPSGKVEPKYAASQILTASGQTYGGVVTTETSQAVVLQTADGKTLEIPRSEIELFQTSDQSLMPSGLEKEISLDQMADLLEFLKSPLPKTNPSE
ncbi:PVC-type heme-binding CxxCH protein [Bremerella cremea]|nr:PVC-type heme-binding CxxCH protein [Bremerella cremea]